MRKNKSGFSIGLIFILLTGAAFAQAPAKQDKKQTVAAAGNPVSGSGAAGQITKWTGVDGSNTYFIGSSNIFEDKFGKIGIGTKAPSSPLTVQGMIETTLGGYKFPDGTVQTTAFDPNQVVRSLNGLRGNIILAEGTNITIVPSGNTLTIASPNSLTGVAHDATLQGNGTTASPLGVAVPLDLSGSVDVGAVLTAANSSAGDGVSGSSRDGAGTRGYSNTGVGVLGESAGSGAGVRALSETGDGVFAFSTSGDGVHGISGGNGIGVRGDGKTGVQGTGSFNATLVGGTGVEGSGGASSFRGGAGVSGTGGNTINATGGAGLVGFGGVASGAGFAGGDGVFATRGLGAGGGINGLAGFFVGDVSVAGKLTKTMGTFKIDHPLDPENKYLYHSFVESPDMMNIYNGNITTDPNGEAVVEMPDYFDALNKDFRYQLTVIGTFAQAIVASEMKDNRFVIKTSAPGVKVSWMVTGVRQDAYAEKNRVRVEENKSERERGYYLHPEVFNQPEEKSIEWARHPEMMQRLKQQRLETEEKYKKQQQR